MVGLGNGNVHHKVRQEVDERGSEILLYRHVCQAKCLGSIGDTIFDQVYPADEGNLRVIGDRTRPGSAHPSGANENNSQRSH
jgi:hypothetical protein